MSNTYLIGCTHFGHHNIIKLANRPFRSLEHMHEQMIERWNKVVKSDDTVIHHGDFSYKGNEPREYEKHLNGNLIRIQGNHDPRNWGRAYYETRIDNRLIVCFHFPIEEWNGYFRDSIHFHCHTHKPTFISARNRANIGADAINFTPILLEEAIERVIKNE